MTDDIETRVESVLTQQEIQAVQFAQDFYGAQAKRAAVRFGEALNMGEEQVNQLVGSIALQLEGVDAEQRRDVAMGLNNVTDMLSGTALRGSQVEAPDLTAAGRHNNNGATAEGAVYPSQGRILTDQAEGSQSPAVDANDGGEPSGEEAVILPLKPSQRRWLSELYEDVDLTRIEELPVQHRSILTARLSRMYTELKIPRLNEESKRRRAEQLVAFMEGQKYAAIATTAGASSASVSLGIRRMTDSITQRVSIEELRVLIPTLSDAGIAQPRHAETEVLQLSRMQRKWFDKVFEDQNDIESIEGLTDEQKVFLAERLTRYLRSYIIRRQGPVRTERRVDQLVRFIQGDSLQEIAELTDQPIDILKRGLHNSAEKLKKKTAPRDLKKIVEESAQYEGEHDAHE
jgi:hypothetical protein